MSGRMKALGEQAFPTDPFLGPACSLLYQRAKPGVATRMSDLSVLVSIMNEEGKTVNFFLKGGEEKKG